LNMLGEKLEDQRKMIEVLESQVMSAKRERDEIQGHIS